MDEQMIGEAVIQHVIQVDVMAAAGSPPLPPVLLNSDQHRTLVTHLSNMISMVGDRLKDDEGLQRAIDDVVRCEDSRLERFLWVTDKVLKDEITWDKIAVLIYVAGKLAGKLARTLANDVVEAHLPQPVKNILEWTKDFFRTELLDWIIDHGGWISGLSELAMSSMRAVTSMTPTSYRLVLFFTMGVALGSLITWGATKRH